MPVAVGVIVALIFLIAFSGWFYHLTEGWRQFVLDDVYFKYRIMAASAVSIVTITLTFFGMAYASECPVEGRVGIFASLNCAEYRNIKVGAENIFKRSPVLPTESETVSDDQGTYFFGE